MPYANLAGWGCNDASPMSIQVEVMVQHSWSGTEMISGRQIRRKMKQFWGPAVDHRSTPWLPAPQERLPTAPMLLALDKWGNVYRGGMRVHD